MKKSDFIIGGQQLVAGCDTRQGAHAHLSMEAVGDAQEFDDDLPEVRSVELAPEHHGWRLDRTLVAIVPEFSRSYLQNLIELGAVQINGAVQLRAACKVRLGDRISVELRPTPRSQAFKPEPIAMDVVHQDAHILVVNKPAGLVVHPAPGNWSGTLLNALLAADAQAASLPRAGIVHRLDKNTSGLMLVARSRSAMDALVAMIAQREISREYLAIASQTWVGPGSVEIESPVGRDPRNRLRMAVVDLARNAGKPAHTTVRLLFNSAQSCLLGCKLHTGRTHQIRVHLASLGYPLVADDVYGGVAAGGLLRQALHAHRLAFKHPATGDILQFEAPLPPDMQAALSAMSLRYN